MKEVKVQQIQPDVGGPVYGQVSNPADFMKSQIFAHGHAEINARDFVVGKCATRAVAGFNYSLLGGLQFRVAAPGQVIDEDGKSYEKISSQPDDFELEAADDTNPRIDLVVVKLETVDAADELRPFVRLRTQQELEDNVAPYPPEQFNQPTEIHVRAVVQIKTGVPAAQPSTPDLESDEEALYAIRVAASATQLDGAGIIDLRNLVASNCELQDRIKAIIDLFNNPPKKHRHDADEVDVDANSPAIKLGVTVQDALDTLALRTDPEPVGAAGPALRPEILRPDLVPYHTESGKLTSSGSVESGVPTVRIPYPRQVAFSTGVFPVDPNAFVDKSLNPRLLNTDPDKGDNAIEHVVDYSLGSIQVIQTDGGGAWSLQGVQLPDPRARSYAGQRLAAPRDGRYLEVMGGAPGAGDSAWYTIDTLNGTIAQRAFTGDIPFFYIRGVFPCGDGMNVIVAEQAGADGGINGSKLNWYKVNCTTGASVKFDSSAPGSSDDVTLSGTPSAVVGDVIYPNVIFLLIKVDGVDNVSAGNGRAWIYHCDTSTFEMISPVGQNQVNGPLAGLTLTDLLQDVDVCLYKPGQAVLVRGIGTQTWIFDYDTRSWGRLQIAQPRGDLNTWTGDRLWGVTLANINGRVQLTSEASSIWELTPSDVPQWDNRGIPAGMGSDGSVLGVPVSGRGFPGLIGMISDGLPRGTGWLVGGRVSNSPKRDVWKFAAGGIVETIFEGVTALTLGAGTRSARFRVANFQLPWEVAHMLITLVGANLQGRVKIEESFDDGATLQVIPINSRTEILSSNSNPNRQLFITLSGSDNVKPILAQSRETFEQTGGGGLGMVYVVYDCPNGTTYLYMDDHGRITSEGAALQTTKTKAILHRVIKDGVDPPILFDFLNKPWYGRKYEGGPKAGGVDPKFADDLAVLPSDIECWRVAADGTVHLLADCTLVFNGDNTVTGLANGESYRVHLAG